MPPAAKDKCGLGVLSPSEAFECGGWAAGECGARLAGESPGSVVTEEATARAIWRGAGGAEPSQLVRRYGQDALAPDRMRVAHIIHGVISPPVIKFGTGAPALAPTPFKCAAPAATSPPGTAMPFSWATTVLVAVCPPCNWSSCARDGDAESLRGRTAQRRARTAGRKASSGPSCAGHRGASVNRPSV